MKISIQEKLILVTNVISFYDLESVIDVNCYITSKPRITLSSYAELDKMCDKLKTFIKVEKIGDNTTRFKCETDILELVYIEVEGVEF